MRRIILLTLCFATLSIRLFAQDVATFEDLYLPNVDTFYVDYSAPGMDVGFYDGLCYFPCIYDTTSKFDSVTSAGDTVLTITPHWRSGFVYSNVSDILIDSLSRYGSIAGSGYNSNNYVAARGVQNYMTLIGDAFSKPLDTLMISNSAFAYNAMHYGGIAGKKFGGATGTDPDWFKVTIKSYSYYRRDSVTVDTPKFLVDSVYKDPGSGLMDTVQVYHTRIDTIPHFILTDTLKITDSQDVYLADFRSANATDHYILNNWVPVYFSASKGVDSVTFTLSSSDNGAGGMNTPAYFCMDNITTYESSTASVPKITPHAAKVYPNPTTNSLYVSINDNTIKQLTVIDMSGRVVTVMPVTSTNMVVNTSSFRPGMYILQLSGTGQPAMARFVKQ